MEYYSMWPEKKKKTPSLPLGVQILYDEDGHEELCHILSFLRSHFALTEKDFAKGVLNTDEPRFPYVWVDKKQIPFKQLVLAVGEDKKMGEEIVLGFPDGHQLTVRAYRAHLDRDALCAEGHKKFFREIEEEYFGTPSKMH